MLTSLTRVKLGDSTCALNEDVKHFHATDRALEDPRHQHVDNGVIADYDVRTGSHYGNPGLQLRHGPDVGGGLVIRTGNPKSRSVASLAAPFKGLRVMSSVSFSYRYNVGCKCATACSTQPRLSIGAGHCYRHNCSHLLGHSSSRIGGVRFFKKQYP